VHTCKQEQNGGEVSRVCTPFEPKHRDLAGRILLIYAIGRKHGDGPNKGVFPLIARQQSGGRSKRFVANLNGDLGMSQQVVVPQRVVRCASFGCHRFYRLGLSQTEIAEKLGVSCFQVARMLRTALEDGYVVVKILEPERWHSDLEQAIEECYGLKTVI